jgi:hypothetical protein
MSSVTRHNVCLELSFNDPLAHADLDDPNKTDTYVIAALQDLQQRQKHRILITAVRSDHDDDSCLGADAHAFGKSVDLWHADWATVGDDKIVDVITALLNNPYVWSVGLGGSAAQYLQKFQALAAKIDSRLIVFQDNGSDHVHFQIGNANGEGMR